MRKVMSYSRVLERLCLFSGANNDQASSEYCNYDEHESKPLINESKVQVISSLKLKDVISGAPTLAFQLKPKIVVMKVSMHCNGCARKVEKHISKLEGVTSYQVDLETKMVVVSGDIVPFEVLESVSKVKNAQLWENNP
ncbi:heavy metal-associated isoprenylated plant protein 32 [Henckelia pumila]|uniref:heavy metal-associated isoprenylated plant protein 32 n=1 Tax=Henckelia pumila TaxID=405737 RepID=UPI003C6DC4B4